MAASWHLSVSSDFCCRTNSSSNRSGVPTPINGPTITDVPLGIIAMASSADTDLIDGSDPCANEWWALFTCHRRDDPDLCRADARARYGSVRLVCGLRDRERGARRREPGLFRPRELHDTRLWRRDAAAELAAARAAYRDERRSHVRLVHRVDVRGAAKDHRARRLSPANTVGRAIDRTSIAPVGRAGQFVAGSARGNLEFLFHAGLRGR